MTDDERGIEKDVRQVCGITLRSLEKATTFLREEGLLGQVSATSVELDRAWTHGRRILLQE